MISQSSMKYVEIQQKKIKDKILATFFLQMKAIFQSKFLFGIDFRTTEGKVLFTITKKTWLPVLKKLTAKELNNGVIKCKLLKKWFPSINEFLKIALDIDDANIAYFFVQQNYENNFNKINKFCIEAIKISHCYDIYMNLSYVNKKKAFESAYKMIVDNFLKERFYEDNWC